MSAPHTFAIRTYGCQMNVHDSEKIANLLHHHGYRPAAGEAEADLLIVNTCSIREKAENQLYSDLGVLRTWRRERPGRALAVGGCVAQQEGDRILKRFPQVDFVFGTHNLRAVPAMLAGALAGQRRADVAESRELERFELPERHPDYDGRSAGRAFLTVMEGCDMFCAFCIVPRTRGREISRPADSIVAEARSLAARGIVELTLLGQTVNAYGRHDLRRGQAEAAGTISFGALLARLAAVPGVRRLRYTSPHPLFFDADLIAAHAEVPAVCPHVHLPLQSGSDRVLAAMRRRYTAERYLEIVAALRTARPDIAITSDLIVGFPGETEDDFEATLAVMRAAGLADSFSFKYSPRPGTTAEGLPDPVAPDVAQDRLERLQGVQRELTLTAHRARVGESTEILLEGPSRRGGDQWTGRDPQHRIVNLAAPPGAGFRPGLLVPVVLLEATPHSLIGELVAAGAVGAVGTAGAGAAVAADPHPGAAPA